MFLSLITINNPYLITCSAGIHGMDCFVGWNRKYFTYFGIVPFERNPVYPVYSSPPNIAPLLGNFNAAGESWGTILSFRIVQHAFYVGDVFSKPDDNINP